MPIYPITNATPFTVNGVKPQEIANILEEFSVVVIENFFSLETCKKFLIDYVPKCTDVLKNMRTVKPGQHKDIICHYPTIWDFRKDSRLEALYAFLYKHFNGYVEYKQVIPSIDAVNIKAPFVGPYHSDKTPDWAHLDQTNGDHFKCIQGQITLTNTTAGFVCSPKSHKVFMDVMKIMNVSLIDKSNWCVIGGKASPEQEKCIREKIESVGGSWQCYVPAPAGSVILWFGATIHSAKVGNFVSKPNGTIEQAQQKALEKMQHWRAVIYVCYRPLMEFNKKEKDIRFSAMKNNQTMNHWSLNVWNKTRPTTPEMGEYLKNPTSWKYFDKKVIENVIKSEQYDEQHPDEYIKKIANIIDLLK